MLKHDLLAIRRHLTVSAHKVRVSQLRVLTNGRLLIVSALDLKPSKNEYSRLDGLLIESAHNLKAAYSECSPKVPFKSESLLNMNTKASMKRGKI